MPPQYEIVVLGSTGYTGKIVTEYLYGQTNSQDLSSCKWAVAGRRPGTLENLVDQLAPSAGPSASRPAVETCDVQDNTQLKSLAEKTRVLINCVGPYRFYGDAVITSCIDAGTHYVDITGETAFIREMMAKHNRSAAASSSGSRPPTPYVVLSCGWDCVPTDMGSLDMEHRFCPEGKCLQVYGFYASKGFLFSGISSGTYQSLLESLANMSQDARGKRKQEAEILAYSGVAKDEKAPRALSLFGHIGISSTYIPLLGARAIPFSTADPWVSKFARVISRAPWRREETSSGKPAPGFKYFHYLTFRGWFGALLTMICMIFIVIFTKLKLTVLLKKLKAPGGPSRAYREANPSELLLVGLGSRSGAHVPTEGRFNPDHAKIVQLSAPNAYTATGLFAVEAAFTILDGVNGRVTLPCSGGTGPPSTLLGKAYLDRLHRCPELKFEVIREGRPSTVLKTPLP